MNWLNLFFGLQRSGTTPSREVVAGLTTFTTMSYIIVVNPAILSAAGIPEGPCFVATILVAVAGCYLMAFCANRPFAVAPYMGENAFVAFTVCKMLGFAWQTALAAIFIAGIAFILLTILRLRQWVVEGVPDSLRFSFATGIGLFLTFIGLNQTGLVVLGVPGAPVRAGHLTSPPALVAMFGFLLLAVLTIRKVPGAILIGIVVTALPAFIAGTASPPKHLLSMPPRVAPILWQLDFRGALTWFAFPVVLTIFIMACVDTMGTLIGLSAHAGFLDESGQLPQIERQCWSMLLPPVFHQLLALPPRALSRVRHRDRSKGKNGPYCPRDRNVFPADSVLLALRGGDSGPGLWTGADSWRPLHAIAYHLHRFQRLLGIHHNVRRGGSDGLHVQYRDRKRGRICALSYLQAGCRRT